MVLWSHIVDSDGVCVGCDSLVATEGKNFEFVSPLNIFPSLIDEDTKMIGAETAQCSFTHMITFPKS